MKKRIILVLGMHRSGTSVLSAGLEALGVDFGNNLLPSRDDNPKGYWEDEQIVALNNQILAEGGVLSGDVGFSLEHFPTDRFQHYVNAAVDLLTKNLDGKPVLGIKDPRMPRLMPVWQEAFQRLDIDVSHVVTVRNPLSVADSLQQRDKLNQRKSFLLWYEHSFRALEASLNVAHIVVEYERLMSFPKEELMRVSDCLSLPIDEEAYQHFSRDIFDTGLCHSRYQEHELASSGNVFPSLIALYDLMQRMARDEPRLLTSILDEWHSARRDFQLIWPLFIFYGDLDCQLWQFSERYRKNRESIENWTDILEKTAAALAENDNRDDQNDHASNGEYRIEEADPVRAMILAQMIYEDRTAFRAEIASLQQRIQEVSQYADHLERQLQHILTSHSWQITAPVRWLVNNLPFSKNKGSE